jgi:proline racemase/trans-L-3-hydroxyproline dehydratase
MKLSRMVTAVDAHTAGMPMRVVIGGVPQIPGRSILEKVRYVRENLDDLRAFLVLEPRGHNGMFAALLTEPTTEGSDVGVIFLNPGGYDTMCGHGTIAICTVLVEMGKVKVEEPETEIVLDTPAGTVRGRVAVKDGLAQEVILQSVPSFLYKSDVQIEVPPFGRLTLDIAYGGDLFYAILPAEEVGLEIRPERDSDIITCGRRIWEALNEQVEAQHPEVPSLRGFAGVIFSSPATHPDATLKNACFGPPGFTDRSPCGTGTCAKMAALYAKGELGLKEEFVHESFIGTLFRGKAIEEVRVGPYRAILPEITGSAYITGIQQFVLDPRDPFPAGFYVGKESKLWGGE